MNANPTTALARRQRQLVADIFDLRAHTNPGLRIYQTNLALTAARALETAYPVLREMIGGEATRMLARLVLRAEPPASGDWADWGANLPQVIASTPLADEHPYLPDLAGFEWKLHVSSRAAGGVLDSDSLARLADTPLDRLAIRLVPAIAIHSSAFPVEVLWQAHKYWARPIDADRLRATLAGARDAGGLLISTRKGKTEITPLATAHFSWVEDVVAGCSIATLLDRHPQFDFSHWLGEAISLGWLERLTFYPTI